MIYDPLVWFTPGYMIHCAVNAKQNWLELGKKPSRDLDKAIQEAINGSLFAMGMDKLHGGNHRVQLVDPDEQSPDVRVMFEVEDPGNGFGGYKGNYYDIEITELGPNGKPNESIADFIKRVKLNSLTRAYDAPTIILCRINRNITNFDAESIHKELGKLGSSNSVFIIGKPEPIGERYSMCRVNPDLDSITDFNMLEEAKKRYRISGGTLFAHDRYRKTSLIKRDRINPFID